MKNLRNENEHQINKRILRSKLIDQIFGIQDCISDLCEGESVEVKTTHFEWAGQTLFNCLQIAEAMQIRNSVWFDNYSKIITYNDAVQFLQNYLKEEV